MSVHASWLNVCGAMLTVSHLDMHECHTDELDNAVSERERERRACARGGGCKMQVCAACNGWRNHPKGLILNLEKFLGKGFLCHSEIRCNKLGLIFSLLTKARNS